MSTNPTEIDFDSLPAELRTLLETRDAQAFEASLDALFARRQQNLFRSLGHLTRDLHESVVRLTRDAEPASSAPDARLRLREAQEMGANAAHENLAMAERLRPRAMRLRDEARTVTVSGASNPNAAIELAHHAEDFAQHCLHDLTRLVETQSWQDLSGQRLQQVTRFIDSVEASLLELVRLTGTISGTQVAGKVSGESLSTQDEVDRLLSDFGF